MNVVGPRYEFDQRKALPTRAVKIWDLPVRLFHWLLVASIAVAAVTDWLLPASWLQLHLIAGTVIGCLVLWRVVWGFTGTRYSRFRSFAFSPRATIAHLKDLVEGKVQREAGHNPLGALMVFALLGSIGTVVLTGVAVSRRPVQAGTPEGICELCRCHDLPRDTQCDCHCASGSYRRAPGRGDL